MKNVITKYRAEQLFGFSGSYTLSDVKKTYRKLVKKAHPDAGGSEEQMIELNQAYEFMEALFNGDTSMIVTCDTEEVPEQEPDPVYAESTSESDESTTYTPGSESTDWGWEAYVPHNYREEAYQRYSKRYDETHSDEAGAYKAYQEAEAARQAARAAREKMYAGEKPMWWHVANTIVSGKASSNLLKAALLAIGLAMLLQAMSGAWIGGSMLYPFSILVFITAAINCFTGTITDDLRKSVKWFIDTMLKRWQKKFTA